MLFSARLTKESAIEMSSYFVGIDTSNYKTSIAVTDENNRIVFQKSEFLDIEKGKRGLRQSVAFFKHSNALPLYIDECMHEIDCREIKSIAVSDRPRNVKGSYMPVFRAGDNAAGIIGASLNLDVLRFSHQEGHIASILYSYPSFYDDKFIVFHLSGGTTEALMCTRQGIRIETEIIGGTKDISAGQLLDRVGVKLGFDFPSGKYLDEYAVKNEIKQTFKRVNTNDGYFNLSGLETNSLRRLETAGADVIPGLIDNLTRLLFDDSDYLSVKYGIKTVFFAGGVAASQYMRKKAETRSNGKAEILFGDRVLSGDNAVGISLLGRKAFYESN